MQPPESGHKQVDNMAMMYDVVCGPFQERQLKWEEYHDLASNFYSWLRRSTDVMLDRNFPPTLVELKVSNAFCILKIAYSLDGAVVWCTIKCVDVYQSILLYYSQCSL